MIDKTTTRMIMLDKFKMIRWFIFNKNSMEVIVAKVLFVSPFVFLY